MCENHFIFQYVGGRSQQRLSDIVTRLRSERSGIRNPAGTRNFSVLQNVRLVSGAHPASHS